MFCNVVAACRQCSSQGQGANFSRALTAHQYPYKQQLCLRFLTSCSLLRHNGKVLRFSQVAGQHRHDRKLCPVMIPSFAPLIEALFALLLQKLTAKNQDLGQITNLIKEVVFAAGQVMALALLLHVT